jgi:hypothetical protein
MAYEAGKNDGSQPDNTETADYNKNQPQQESGKHLPSQQDPSKKNPSQTNDPRSRNDEDSEQVEKRSA